jgi:hypothetical protein
MTLEARWRVAPRGEYLHAKKDSHPDQTAMSSHRLAFGLAAVPQPTSPSPLSPKAGLKNADANQHQNQSGILVQTATP